MCHCRPLIKQQPLCRSLTCQAAVPATAGVCSHAVAQALLGPSTSIVHTQVALAAAVLCRIDIHS
jgi:hypothetical protein